MKVWLARDKEGLLKMFLDEPHWEYTIWTIHGCWGDEDDNVLRVYDDTVFPEVTFENSPMQVDLVIK